jgi:hypothetical protein
MTSYAAFAVFLGFAAFDWVFAGAFFFAAPKAFIRAACCLRRAGVNIRFFRGGCSEAVEAPFDVTQSGMDADFGGHPRLFAGDPPSKEIAAGHPIQPQIESIHFALVQVIPDDSTSEADILGEFE